MKIHENSAIRKPFGNGLNEERLRGYDGLEKYRTNQLTPRIRIFLEKLTVTQTDKSYLAFSGTQF
jgi:hypothetical protein